MMKTNDERPSGLFNIIVPYTEMRYTALASPQDSTYTPGTFLSCAGAHVALASVTGCAVPRQLTLFHSVPLSSQAQMACIMTFNSQRMGHTRRRTGLATDSCLLFSGSQGLTTATGAAFHRTSARALGVAAAGVATLLPLAVFSSAHWMAARLMRFSPQGARDRSCTLYLARDSPME